MRVASRRRGTATSPSGPSARSFSTCTVVVRTTGKLYCSTEPALLRHATRTACSAAGTTVYSTVAIPSISTVSVSAPGKSRVSRTKSTGPFRKAE